VPYGTKAPKELLHHLPATGNAPAFCVRMPTRERTGNAGIAGCLTEDHLAIDCPAVPGPQDFRPGRS